MGPSGSRPTELKPRGGTQQPLSREPWSDSGACKGLRTTELGSPVASSALSSSSLRKRASEGSARAAEAELPWEPDPLRLGHHPPSGVQSKPAGGQEAWPT